MILFLDNECAGLGQVDQRTKAPFKIAISKPEFPTILSGITHIECSESLNQ